MYCPKYSVSPTYPLTLQDWRSITNDFSDINYTIQKVK